MDGWRQAGTICVKSHPGIAYAELWRNATGVLRWIGIVWLAAAVSLVGLLRRILQPLQAVETMALQIANREFPVLEPLPRSRELRRVVSAMNQMSATLRTGYAEQSALTEALREQAYGDPVTQIANRRAFDSRLDYLVRTPDAFAGGALFVLHITNFQQYNLAHGHNAGDQVLRAAARAIAHHCASTGRDYLLARLTGAQFGILFSAWSVEAIGAFADTLIDRMDRLHHRTGTVDPFRVYCGVTLYRGQASGSDLLAEADMALREARQQGVRGWYRLHSAAVGNTPSDITADGLRRLVSANLKQGTISMHTTPVFQLPDLTLLHLEVLARLSDGRGKLIPAQAFIPIAQQMGCVCDLDRLIVKSVFRVFDTDLRPDRCYAVNLSTESLSDSAFMAWLCGLLERSPHLARRLAFECREFDLLSDRSALKTPIRRLLSAGSRFGVDHFGLGARPFGYLIDLQPTYLKMDGSFVQGIAHSRENRFFIRSTASAVHSIGISLVAMGVEDAGNVAQLRELGFDAVQGRGMDRDGTAPGGGEARSD